MSSEFRNILKHSAIYGLSNMLSKMIGFLMIPVYTRVLTTEDFGLRELLQNTMNILGIIVGMGFAVAILRFYSEDKDEEARETVIATSILGVAFSAALIVGIAFVFRRELSYVFLDNRAYTHPFTVMLFILFFTSMIEIPLVVVRAREKSKVYFSVCLAQLLLGVSFNLLFMVFLRLGVAGWLLSTLWTSVSICTYLIISTFWTLTKIRFSFPLFRRMFIYTMPLIPASLAMFWIHNGDRYILNHEDGFSEVGIYSLGYTFAMMIPFLVGQPFFMAWQVRMFDVFEQKGGEKVFARTFTLFASAILLFWLILSVVIKDVIAIVSTDSFHQAYLIVPLVSMGYVLREFSDFFKGVLLITRKTSFVGYSTIIAALVSTGLYLYLIPRYGRWGAAWATALTFFTMMVCMYFAAQRAHKVPFQFKWLAVMVTFAVILMVICSRFSFTSPYLNVMVKGLLCLVFYPALYLCGFFHEEEKTAIRRRFRKLLFLSRSANS